MGQTIGDIGNYYGCLEIKKEDGKYFWSIECYSGHHWDEISKELYYALLDFEASDMRRKQGERY